MSIRLRLLLSLVLTASVAFYFLSRWLRDDVKSRYFQILEDSLAETANLIAAAIEIDAQTDGTLRTQNISCIIDAALKRKISADIFGTKKEQITLRIYATDAAGKVIYDSAGFGLAKDYSRWIDVYRTLRGGYGARSSRDDPRYKDVSIKYVAAPIHYREKIIGVLTTAKPAVTLEQVIGATKDKILITIALVFAAFIMIAFAVNFWITRPIDLLIRWVKNLRLGVREPLPALGRSEIGTLGREFELMRTQLDGRKYIEDFVQLMTHEFKSPIAGILGAAEILERDLSESDKKIFLGNIQREAGRLGRITENLLLVATLENMRALPKPEWVHPAELFAELAEDFAHTFKAKNISFVVDIAAEITFQGNYFFLYQAFSNLLQNSADFCGDNGSISARSHSEAQKTVIVISDNGTGIPEYALDKIFAKFYSLERPDTQRKGTGLGLAFVEQVIKLHRGDIKISNRASGGVTVVTVL